MRQDTCPGAIGHSHGLLGRPFPVGWKAVGEMDEAATFILRDLLLVGIVAGIDKGLVGGQELGDDVLVPLENPANQVIRIADQYPGVVVGEHVCVLEYFACLVILEEFLKKAQDARFLQLGIVVKGVDQLADTGFVVQFSLGGCIEKQGARPLVRQGVGEGMGDFLGLEASSPFAVWGCTQFAAEHGIGKEENGGEGVTHAGGATGVLDVLLHQGDESLQFGFPRVASQNVPEFHGDGLLHHFAGERLGGIDEGDEFLLGEAGGYEFAVLDGVGGLSLHDGHRVAEQLRCGGFVHLGRPHVTEEKARVAGKGVADEALEALGGFLAESLVDLGAVSSKTRGSIQLGLFLGKEKIGMWHLVGVQVVDATGEIAARSFHLRLDPGKGILHRDGVGAILVVRWHLIQVQFLPHHRPAGRAITFLHVRIQGGQVEIALLFLRSMATKAMLFHEGLYLAIVGRHVFLECLLVRFRQGLVALGIGLDGLAAPPEGERS